MGARGPEAQGNVRHTASRRQHKASVQRYATKLEERPVDESNGGSHGYHKLPSLVRVGAVQHRKATLELPPGEGCEAQEQEGGHESKEVQGIRPSGTGPRTEKPVLVQVQLQ